MSDPAQPSPAGVNPSTVPPAGDSTNNNYAFLVHSQKSLTQNLPPKVDNKALARQKRRRTSPDDQKILEAEYQRNPKPDRATRAEIVNSVSLGEKEVQIWFQNRRQNDRRRSKPLNQEDLRAPKSSGSDQDASNGDNPTNPKSQSSQLPKAGQGTGGQISTDARREYICISPGSSYRSPMADLYGAAFSSQTINSQTTVLSQHEETHVEVGKQKGSTGGSKEGSATLINEKLHIESISRKRSRSEPEAPNTNKYSPPTSSTFIPPPLRISLSFDGEAVVRKEGENTPSPQKPLDSIRISMSADGEALIRAANEESPIKNRTFLFHNTRPAFGGLRRSISAFPLGALKGIKEQQDPKPFGRSRDSRNWELYCDTDARTALQGSKSSLLSSTSRSVKLSRRKSDLGHGRKALMPRTNLPNTLPLTEEPEGKRKKLSRAMSSLARLETGHKVSTSKMGVGEGAMDYHTGDSDKENWIPGTQMSAARRAPSNKQKARRGVLQKPNQIQNTSNRQVTGSNKTQRGYQGRLLNPNPNTTSEDADDGTEKSYGELGEISRLSQDEDLDCIQGLLSLSQGAWK
ncbi:homeobox transcription factor [Blastomyces gilchristii SLH14081]|uniref:Homeobox transcription factor n=1 Tax=Blastomyces gilchristii (strain SLH14081) TaxID=559298 RepID=A0A179UZM0_BLAGS|nr:homeobox transcription factor [Blastomyces gilchristii SLH14081]OAT12567.1 homeobox transcription factor [Blastomyces gilchristii SLH14081]